MVNQLRGSVSQFKIAETLTMFDLGQLPGESELVGVDTPPVVEAKPPAPSGSKLKKAPKATLDDSPNSMDKTELARKLREAKGVGERSNIAQVRNSTPESSTQNTPTQAKPTRAKPIQTKPIQAKPTGAETGSATNCPSGRRPAPTTPSAVPEVQSASDRKRSNPQTMILGEQAPAENSSTPVEQAGISPTMMIDGDKISAQSDPKTEYANDESLLRELRDFSDLQNGTKEATGGNEPVPREPSRTIILDNN
jgi:hypothetical protein